MSTPQITPFTCTRFGMQFGLGGEVRVERRLRVARQPTEDLVDLGLGAPLLLRLSRVVRVDGRDGHRVDAVLGHCLILADGAGYGIVASRAIIPVRP